jgi:hypothetical protein
MNTAQAETSDKRIINFTRTNSSWYDWGMGARKVGDKFDVPDTSIRTSDKGNAYIERLTAEKYVTALTLEKAHLEIGLLQKRYERESAL